MCVCVCVSVCVSVFLCLCVCPMMGQCVLVCVSCAGAVCICVYNARFVCVCVCVCISLCGGGHCVVQTNASQLTLLFNPLKTFLHRTCFHPSLSPSAYCSRHQQYFIESTPTLQISRSNISRFAALAPSTSIKWYLPISQDGLKLKIVSS